MMEGMIHPTSVPKPTTYFSPFRKILAEVYISGSFSTLIATYISTRTNVYPSTRIEESYRLDISLIIEYQEETNHTMGENEWRW